MLASKPSVSDTNFNDHRLRKFPSHYFSEMENDNETRISSMERSGLTESKLGVRDSDGNVVNFREANNWIDKFHTGHAGVIAANPTSNGGSNVARATLTDGNYGVGRSGYESAFSTLLHYPSFMDVGKLNTYTYRGGSPTTDGTAASGAYVPADVAHSNQVYGMKVADSEIDTYDENNKGQQFNNLDIVPAEGQTADQAGDAGDLDFNGQGGADGSMFAERSQFYQNEASRFATGHHDPDETPTYPKIDDQWRNPDHHNYVQLAGLTAAGEGDGDSAVINIYRQYNRGTWSDGDLADSLTNIIENNPTFTNSARYTPIEYKNGLVEASKCHQCCNTDHNCNWNWQPTTKVDWNFAYVWRYQAIEQRSNPDNSGQMGVGGNGRDWTTTIPTLSQDIGDFHFNFPPYMANHAINRGNGRGENTSFGDPQGADDDASATTISDAGAYTYNTNGFFALENP